MDLGKSLKSRVKRIVVKAFESALSAPEVQAKIWKLVHRPRVQTMGPENVWLHLWRRAADQTAEYIEKKMITVPYYDDRLQLMEKALAAVTVDGLYLEFGSGYSGRTINFIAGHTGSTVHGFDSFEGLPEAWYGELGKGSLKTANNLPQMRENVRLHAGWFDESVPVFATHHEGGIAFMHIDCDLYSSTKTVFDGLADRVVPGTVIQFDEYFNYPGWREHEYKAFQEFAAAHGLEYEYIGYDRLGYSVAVRITERIAHRESSYNDEGQRLREGM